MLTVTVTWKMPSKMVSPGEEHQVLSILLYRIFWVRDSPFLVCLHRTPVLADVWAPHPVMLLGLCRREAMMKHPGASASSCSIYHHQ